MKRRLNILCVLVILTLCFSVVEVSYYFFLGARAGVESVGEDENTSMGPKTEIANMRNVHLIPDAISMSGGDLMRDSVYNVKSGTYVPAAYASMVISVKGTGVWSAALVGLLNFVVLLLLLQAMVVFAKFVVAINRLQIFCWDNVRRLRRLGVLLLFAFACTWLAAYLNQRQVAEVFALDGYVLSLSECVPVTIPVLGLCALIVAEVFAIGLKMKEEQDLTI